MADRTKRIGASGTFEVKKVTIANGASATDIADLGGMRLAAIGMPAAWTAAGLYFKVGYDGDAVQGDLQDSAGADYTIAVTAGKVRIVELRDFLAFSTLQLQSGPTGGLVNQGAAREFTLYLVP